MGGAILRISLLEEGTYYPLLLAANPLFAGAKHPVPLINDATAACHVPAAEERSMFFQFPYDALAHQQPVSLHNNS